MRADLPDKFRDAGPWTPVYEPGRFLRMVYWPFEKLAGVYRVTEKVCEKFYRFWHPFAPFLRDPEYTTEKPAAPVRGFPVVVRRRRGS